MWGFQRLVTIFLFVSMVLVGCGESKESALKVGTIAGPETRLMEVASTVALERYGLKVHIVAFSDYLQPDAALSDGSIDINLFQHQAFLDQQNQDHHYNLVSIGKAFIYPMGFYPGKTRSLKALPDRAIIALPNDPSNEGRALMLLEKMRLLQLKAGVGFFAAPADIVSNPRHLSFRELDAAQLTRSLRDVDAAVINTNYAVEAGLSPARDALFHEGADSPWANVFAVRADRAKDPRMQQLVRAFQSAAVLAEAKKIFGRDAIPAWQETSP